MSRLSLLHSSDPGPSPPSSPLSSSHHLAVPRSIHIDSHVAMTGASRFLHPHSSGAWYLSPPAVPWTYNRSETLREDEYGQFDYHVAADPSREWSGEEWEVVEVVRGWEGFPWEKQRVGEGSVAVLKRLRVE